MIIVLLLHATAGLPDSRKILSTGGFMHFSRAMDIGQ